MAPGKSEETRQRLVEAAFDLFQKHGFDQVTVSQIAAEAGVSRRTFFRHFGSKERVVFPFSDERLERFRLLMRDRTGGAPASFADLRAVFVQIIQDWSDNQEQMFRGRQMVAQSSALLAIDFEVNLKWARVVSEVLDGEEVLSEGEDASPSLKSQMIAGAFLGAMRPVFQQWHASKGDFDLAAAGNDALDLIENIFNPPTD